MSEVIYEFGYEYNFKHTLTNTEENCLRTLDVFYRELARSMYYDYDYLGIEASHDMMGCKIICDSSGSIAKHIALFSKLVSRLKNAINCLQLPVTVSTFENRAEVHY